ncbi:MAG: twin-arginine translocase TatA/TatE family subunit [Clostridia bacterium]|nr:twin-arginine translocase TatA/TatE family subunit [Clostridia bacterium]
MFNIGFAELIVVLLVAFLIVGPKDLPKVARWIARQVKSIRRLVNEVKKETGWDEFSKEFKDTKSDLEKTFKEADISGELKEAERSVKETLQDVKKDIEE